MKNYSWILMLSFIILTVNVHAQSTWNPAAPMNPVPLKYTTAHCGLKGPVKTVDNMEFDAQGLITKESGDDGQTFTYSKTGIEVITNEYTFQYKYNETGQIATMAIAESQYNSTYSYDDNGNLISVFEVEGPNQMEVLYKYDDQNRLKRHSRIYGEDTLTRAYNYFEEGDKLEITEVIVGDNSSRTVYVYKDGVLDNYKQMGVMQREDIEYDIHENWVQFYSPVYGTTTTRSITYY